MPYYICLFDGKKRVVFSLVGKQFLACIEFDLRGVSDAECGEHRKNEIELIWLVPAEVIEQMVFMEKLSLAEGEELLMIVQSPADPTKLLTHWFVVDAHLQPINKDNVRFDPRAAIVKIVRENGAFTASTFQAIKRAGDAVAK